MDETEKKVAELNAILARDEADILVYTKGDGSVGTFLRYGWCPRWAWSAYKAALRALLPLRRRPPISDAETALLRDEY